MKEIKSLTQVNSDKASATGIVVPHAGFMYSGKVAGEVYSRIKMPDTMILLGPNHYGMGAEFSIATDGVWRTPLGETLVDALIAKEIYKRSRHLKEDEFAHVREHSLEVQLPFIQYFSPKTQIVPISLRHYQPDGMFLKICEDIGVSIAEAVAGVKASVTVAASTDFTHYAKQEIAKANDKAALDAILALDAKKLFSVVKEKDISMCGYAPVAVTIFAAKKLGAKKAELVRYMTSGDSTGDYSSVVGYGGVIMR
jgi:hypothetical protein